MEGHAVAALPKEQLKIGRTSCWGTCEELLLVSAVKRHGGRSWNLISEELKARSVSLNVSSRYFSEAACKEKYDILRDRLSNSSSSSRSRSEDLENVTDWCEELRRLRVADLKRELIHYDGSVGALQVKIKRLKAENSEDAVLSEQPRKTIKSSQSSEEARGDCSCEISVHRSSGKYQDLHATPVVLVSEMDSEEDLWCQEPFNVRNQAFPEDKVSASNMHEHPKLAFTRIGYLLADGYQLASSMVSHEAGDVPSDAMDNNEGDAVIMDGQHMNVLNDEMGSVETDYGQEGMDTILDISAGSIVYSEISKNGGSDHAAAETYSKDGFFPVRPSSQVLLSSGTVGNAEDGNGYLTMVTVGRVNLSINEEGAVELEKKRTVATEDAYHSILEVDLNKQVHVALPFDLTKAESGVQLGRNLSECCAGIAHTTPEINSILNSTRKIFNVSEGCHASHKGLTSAILDELASCDQKQTLWEEDSVKKVDSTLRVVKKSATFGVECEELDRCSDDVAGESVSTSKESEKIRVSAVRPMSLINLESCVFRDGPTIILEKSGLSESASRSSELSYKSDVAEGSPSPERHIIITLDGPGGSAPNSEIVSISPANCEDSNAYQIETPTRSDAVCNSQARGTVEELHISAVSSRIAASCEEMDWATLLETPATVTDLLEEAHMKGQANPLQSASLVVHPVPCPDVASCTIVKTAIVSTIEPGKISPIVTVRVGHDAEMTLETVIHCDRQPYTLESSRGDFDPQNSSAIHGVEVKEINGLVANQDAFLIDIAEIREEPSESRGTCDEQHLQSYRGQSSELAIPASLEVEGRQSIYNCMIKSSLVTLTAGPDSRVVVETDRKVTVDIRQDGTDLKDGSHGAESKLPENVLNMHLEFSKEGLHGVESDADPSSPLESLTGGLYSMMPSGHEGSDSVQGQYDDEPKNRNRGGIQQNGDSADSDVDKSEAGSPLVGPNEISPSRKETRVSRKLFPLLEVFRNLSNHKSAIFFKGRQEDPRYNSLIRRHLDLNSVRSRLDECSYSSSNEFFRDLLLVFNNAMVYYTRGSVQYRGARALVAEATKEMNRVFWTECLMKQDRPTTRTREVKKPIASAGISIPRKIVAPVIEAGSSGNLADIVSPLTNLPASGIRKRSSSRLGFVETLMNSHSEAVAARRARASFLGDLSSNGTEDAEYYYRETDQKANGSLKERKNHQKGSGFCWGKQPREELLEGTLLKNAAIMSSEGTQMRGVKENEASARKLAVSMTGVRGKSMADLEFAKQREAVNEKTRRVEVEGVGRNEINDQDFLQKEKTFIKWRGLDVTPEKEPDGKPIPKLSFATAFCVASKSHGTISQVVGRSFRGGRKPVIIDKEPVRPSEPQAKKRMRK